MDTTAPVSRPADRKIPTIAWGALRMPDCEESLANPSQGELDQGEPDQDEPDQDEPDQDEPDQDEPDQGGACLMVH
ncbi:hypothetical protein [Aureliella helgolandensis]|nr:hypothetical protein [Aureliella helgolandensis]